MYGRRVCVLESHEHLGGCAHGFERRGYSLDSGPSLWSGCSVPSTNPLRQVMDAAGCAGAVDWVAYDGWGLHDLETGARWRMTVGSDSFDAVVRNATGEATSWRRFLASVDPVVDAAMACPPMALRTDPLGFILTAFIPYLLPAVARASWRLGTFAPALLTGASSQLFKLGGKEPRTAARSTTTRGADEGGGKAPRFVRRWVEYLAFAISGLTAEGTVGAAVAYTLGDLYHEGAFLDYPMKGSGAVAEALADAIERRSNGSQVRTRAHVDEILVERGRAVGVRLRRGGRVLALQAVISNADIWTTATKLLKEDHHKNLPPAALAWRRSAAATVPTPSFVHLWCGFDAAGVPEDLDVHHSVFNKGFESSTKNGKNGEINATRGMHIISIPSLFDPGLAPPGRHVAHVYAAANEPYERWAAMDAAEYERAKAEAAEPLWAALEAVIPDLRQGSRTVDLVVLGTPLTHARFNRRHMGTYGPGGRRVAGDLEGFADGSTPVRGLFTVGDSNFPGIGVPAAAASGILVANSLVSLQEHRRLLDDMARKGTLQAGRSWWAQRPTRPLAKGGRIALDADLDVLGGKPSNPSSNPS